MVNYSAQRLRRIAARPSIVFDALSAVEGLTSWWGPDDFAVLSAETDFRVGGNFKVKFRPAEGSQHVRAGDFLEVEKPVRTIMSGR
jgi:uncharacterized protein YndB with AHSA1/START domain